MSREIRVALVNKLYYPVIGGVETHVRDLSIYLPSHIQRKVLACSENRRRKVEIIDDVEVIKSRSLGVYFSSPVPLGFIKELRALEHWADIFHFHFPFPPGEVSFLLSGIKKPLIVTYHSDIVRQKFLLKFYEPFLIKFLKKADLIIATSPNYIETSPYLRRFKEKCRVIPLGIDTEKYKTDESIEKLKEDVRKEIGAPFVLFVGRLIYYKGVEYLIKAFKSIPEPYKLVLVGGGPLEESLKKLAEETGIKERVVFLKHQPFEKLVALYHTCELFVLPSVERTEAFGIVQLEAQACRKPVVTTELGTGTSYANLDGVTGLVVPPRNEKALADAIKKILFDEKLRQTFSKNAYERVLRDFDVRRMAENVANIYTEVVKRA
ncbi:MAG: glycosyltransferase [Actinobacteria bacterium]|nr:glycosyltransferase [Actinomycetota bacterium]